jgi:mycofactocin precursor
MVTWLAPPHTVTNIRRRQPSHHPGVAAVRHRRIPMQQDDQADTTQAGESSRHTDNFDAGADPGITEELLVEEISIDGMCGVY